MKQVFGLMEEARVPREFPHMQAENMEIPHRSQLGFKPRESANHCAAHFKNRPKYDRSWTLNELKLVGQVTAHL